jgi:hypothetical protein
MLITTTHFLPAPDLLLTNAPVFTNDGGSTIDSGSSPGGDLRKLFFFVISGKNKLERFALPSSSGLVE